MKRLLLVMTLVVMVVGVAFAAGSQSGQAGKYRVELATQPAQPVVGTNQVILTIRDGAKPVNGAGVTLHLDMVGMSMPADVKATPGTQAGQYIASINLSMAGQWTITANVQEMAGMAMDGDGKATFTVTAQPANAGGASAPTTPATPAAPPASAGLPLPLIFGVAAVGIIVVIIARSRRK